MCTQERRTFKQYQCTVIPQATNATDNMIQILEASVMSTWLKLIDAGATMQSFI